MTSDPFILTSKEQSLASHFSLPKSKIKPLISISPQHHYLNEEKLKKKLALHSTTGRDFTFTPFKTSIPFPHTIRNAIKPLRNQHHLSKLSYGGPNISNFTHNLFFSKLKNISALSSLKLTFSEDLNDTLKLLTSLVANLPSYKRLVHLDLYFFNFKIDDIKLFRLLFHGLQALKPTLKSLSISLILCINMKDVDLKVMTSFLGKFRQLEVLKLIFLISANFSDQELRGLAAAIFKLKLLRTLCIDFGNCFMGNTIAQYFTSLQQLQNLSELTLNFSKGDYFQAVNHTTKSIVAGLLLIKSLPIQNLVLNLRTLHQDSEDLCLSRILPQFTLLKSLALHFTKENSDTPFKDQDFIGILACLKEFPNLSSLRFSFENLIQLVEIISNIGGALRYLSGLMKLELRFSLLNCTDEDMARLCSGLGCLTSLKSLELNLNLMKQTIVKGADALTGALKKMVQLKNLLLDVSGNNFLMDQGFSDFCLAIKSMRNLTHLHLKLSYSHQLSYKSAEELAEALKSLDYLESFNFNYLGIARVFDGQHLFMSFFEALKEKKTIQDVDLTLGVNFVGIYPLELKKFKQRKNFSFY